MARKTTKKSAADAAQEGQADPRAPLDWERFIAAAQPVMKLLRDDLLARAKGSPAVSEALRSRHDNERSEQRTADSFVEWQGHLVEQVAAAWLLSCVFVRTLEDRGLLDHARLAGPGASDSLRLFLELAPSSNERDYLLTVFRELTRFAATRALFDARHNPVWLLAPSAEGANALVRLFQSPRPETPTFRFGQADTAFLGWIYQDLDAEVRARYALLQTPRFVESFILDRTLEPAIAKFGLDDTTLIDPTCGSGHFLLGAFQRLLDHHLRTSPGLEPREAARKALDAIHGADINPYAVAIARFRLTLAFLDAAGFTRLSDAPALPLHVVVADSLLHNPFAHQGDLADLAPTSEGWRGTEFALEDEPAARAVLYRRYTTVVGNPPYITVKDAVLRDRYRKLYPRSAAMNYSVAAPFTERFFQLAKDGGRIGMITANSFMKREFGKKLIEQYLPTVNLDLVINTSGAYIPEHGTPTVLLFGSHEPPRATTVATVLASRGEPSTPEDAEQGFVWRSIADHWHEQGFENEFISVATTPRSALSKHPWSLGGGGATELKELLEDRAERTLGDIAELPIGRAARTGNDDVFALPPHSVVRLRVPDELWRDLLTGEVLRDWSVGACDKVLYPYDPNHGFDVRAAEDPLMAPALRFLWPFRTKLADRATFQGKMADAGREWFEYMQYTSSANRTPLSITFAFVATHNHFVLDRGGKVFKQSAPIIKLPATATEDDHLALLAYLNSSTACFWMKQVFAPKGMHNASESNATPYLVRFEFDGTKLSRLPIPESFDHHRSRLAELARQAEAAATERAGTTLLGSSRELGSEAAFNHALERRTHLLETMIALQEEIDWIVYEMFGLWASSGLDSHRVERIALGARPFEVVLGRVEQRIGGKSYFDWHGSAPRRLDQITSPIQRARIAEIERRDSSLTLLESPEAKRRWVQPSGKAAQSLETDDKVLLDEAIASIERLAETLVPKSDIWHSRTLAAQIDAETSDLITWMKAESIGNWVAEYCERSAVPYLAAHRYSASGMELSAEWQTTWDLQRREDAGEKLPHPIPIPPKYAQPDYRSPTFWQLRGPLDVPKERFISYPHCESDHDPSPLYGWAGWDHEQRAKSLATLYWHRKTEESWPAPRLTPLLAGLLELLPWLKQWHAAPSDDYGGDSPASYYSGFLDGECRHFGLTHDDLRAWRPPDKSRGRAAKKPAATSRKPSKKPPAPAPEDR